MNLKLRLKVANEKYRDSVRFNLYFLAMRLVTGLVIVAFIVPLFSPVFAKNPNTVTNEESAILTDNLNLFSKLPKSLFGFSDLGYPSLLSTLNATAGLRDADAVEKGAIAESARSKAREDKVREIQTELGSEVTLDVGEKMQLSSLPLDEGGKPVHFVIPRWRSNDSNVVSVDSGSVAEAVAPGVSELIAEVGEIKRSVKVTVKTKDDKTDTRFVEGCNPPNRTSKAGKIVSSNALLSVAKGNFSKMANGSYVINNAPSNAMLVEDPNAGYDDPVNDIGKPGGRTEPGAATSPAAVTGTEMPGSANFSFSVPLLNLPGRGQNLPLALSYNSRVWHKVQQGTALPPRLYYGINGGGFRLNFGSVEGLETLQNDEHCPVYMSEKGSVISPDGTHHTVYLKSPPTELVDYRYESNDGDITVSPSAEGTVVRYANGTEIIMVSRQKLGT